MSEKIKNSNNSLLLVIVWVVGAVTLLLILLYIILIFYNNKWSFCSFIDAFYHAIRRNPGDLSWGTIGVLLTIESVLLVVMTFRTQRQQFKEQYDTEYGARFENTFFNLMTMFYNVREMTNCEIASRKHTDKNKDCDNLEQVSELFLTTIRNDTSLGYAEEALQATTARTEEELKAIRADYGAKFSQFLKENKFSLSYYFRYISNMIDYVIDYWKENEEKIHVYLNFIQAQMSDAELSMIFYNCLSQQSKNSERQYSLRDKLNKYNFLQNISEDWLIDRSHHIFFSSTKFRFLNENELESKSDARKISTNNQIHIHH